MAASLSTACVPPSKRLEYWRDAVCDVFMHLDVNVPEAERPGFNGLIVNRATGGRLQYSQVSAAGQKVLLTSYGVSRMTADSYYLLLQRTGLAIVEQDKKTAVIRPGEFALFRPTTPLTMVLPEQFNHDILEIPGPLLRQGMQDPERMCGRTITTATTVAKLFVYTLEKVRDTTDEIGPTDAASVEDALIALLSGALRSAQSSEMAAAGNLEVYHRERIRAVVRKCLFDPELSVGSIATQVNLSQSYIHRLFSSEGKTLSAWIWEQRLEAAYRALRDPEGRRRSITEVAHAVGFKDLAHFSRMFKGVFGCCPSDFRRETALQSMVGKRA